MPPIGQAPRSKRGIEFHRGTTVYLNEVKDWGTENTEVVGMDESQYEGSNTDVVKHLQQPQHEVLLAFVERTKHDVVCREGLVEVFLVRLRPVLRKWCVVGMKDLDNILGG